MKKIICLSVVLFAVFIPLAVAQDQGSVSIFAGTGVKGFSGDGGPATQGQFNSPAGLAIDLKGNIYIADQGNARIRRIDSNGVVTTFAGNTIIANGPGPVSGNGGLATQAEIGVPVAVAVDDTGNVYIKDSWNNVIRRVNPSGIISTFRGEWPKSLSPYSFDADLGGAVKKTIDGIIRIIARRWDLDKDTDTQGNPFIPMPAKFSPAGSAVSPDGFVYISCSQTNRIYKLKPFTDSISSVERTFTVKPWKGDSPGSIVFLSVGPTQPPPTATQPPPVVTQPPPVIIQPPPTATQPPPTSTQPPPVVISLEPKIYVSRESLDFRSDGITRIGIAVMNSGSAPLEITRIVIGGPDSLDFSVSPMNLMIEVEKPGPQNNVGKVSIEFTPRTAGEKRARLFLYHNAPNSPAVVELRGVSNVTPEIKPSPDFNGDGWVNFDDFFLFASVFGGKATSDSKKFDLDGDGIIGFMDFFIFAEAFGKKAP